MSTIHKLFNDINQFLKTIIYLFLLSSIICGKVFEKEPRQSCHLLPQLTWFQVAFALSDFSRFVQNNFDIEKLQSELQLFEIVVVVVGYDVNCLVIIQKLIIVNYAVNFRCSCWCYCFIAFSFHLNVDYIRIFWIARILFSSIIFIIILAWHLLLLIMNICMFTWKLSDDPLWW